MICKKCTKNYKALYFNKKTNKWECEKCTEYLKSTHNDKERF